MQVWHQHQRNSKIHPKVHQHPQFHCFKALKESLTWHLKLKGLQKSILPKVFQSINDELSKVENLVKILPNPYKTWNFLT